MFVFSIVSVARTSVNPATFRAWKPSQDLENIPIIVRSPKHVVPPHTARSNLKEHDTLILKRKDGWVVICLHWVIDVYSHLG